MAVKDTVETKPEVVKEENVVESVVSKAKKTAEKKTALKAEKKTPAKKSAPKSEKPVVKKETVFVQFAGKEINMDTIVESARADFKANHTGNVRKLEIYVKPEEHAAYYVVNSKTTGKIDL